PLRTYAPSIGADLEGAVMSGLARSRDDRPASAAEFANHLAACIEPGSPTRVTVPVSPMPGSRVTTGPLVGPTAAQPATTAPQSGKTTPDFFPTMRVGQPPPKNEPDPPSSTASPEIAGYGSPSSYVTRQSTTPMVSGPGGPVRVSAERQ